jgi:aspartate aminotransferase-like enzyme
VNLRIPGPTPLPPQVLKALQRPMINHRGSEFSAMQKSIVARLQNIFETQNDVLILPGSGTAGLEAAVVNVLSPGDQVLACVIGAFGERFAQIATAFGARVEKMTFPMGMAVDLDKVAEKLKKLTQLKAVLVTHNETSTGVLNPLHQFARLVRQNSDALLMVDAVSSLGATELAGDAWGIDVVITGSQKTLMSPPGAAFVSISERAWRANESARMPRFYWDWREWKKWFALGQTPVTPPLPVYYAVDAALDLLLEEGIQNVYARHAHLAELTRTRARAMGFKLLPDARFASPAVTALYPPAGADASELIRRARDEHGVEFADGQGELKGKIVRIGHVGYVHQADIEDALNALERVLQVPSPMAV